MAYVRLSRTLANDRLSLQELLLATPYMALQQRKTIVTISRCQSLPLPGTLTRIRLARDLNTFVHSPVQGRSVTLLSLVLQVPELESPLLSGFVSMMVRCAPLLDEDEAREAIRQGIEKEMTAAIEIYHPRTINWGPIFHSWPSHRTLLPIIPGYPIDPPLLDTIHYALQSTKHKLSSTVFYPDYSNKTIGKSASRNLGLINHMWPEEDLPNTTLGLERVYHRFGIQIQGETEARWAWKYNDLKPRIYYARGPDQYYDSRYIQAVFNIIVDCLPVTNRFERFLAQTIRIPPLHTLFIYDYTSFTSRLHEIVNFIDELGAFYQGTMVTIVDTNEGIKRVDLGDLIKSWNTACQKFPSFSNKGLVGDADEEEILVHNCGMLGVPGNISSCTFLHGLHLAILLSSLLCKAIGDDAIGDGLVDSLKGLHSCLSEIGEISLPKMEHWDPGQETREDIHESTWNYTKRPIDRVGDRVFIGDQVIFPPVGVLFSWDDNIRTSRSPPDRYHRMKRTANMLFSFARQFESMELLEEERTFVNRFVNVAAQRSGLAGYADEPYGKRLLYPRSIECGRVVDGVLEDHWNCVVEVPVWENASCRREKPKRLETFKTPSHRMVKLMRDLGHADVKPLRKSVIVREAETELRLFFSKSRLLVPMYEVYIFESCPDWMFDFLASSSPYATAHDVSNESNYGSDSEED